MNIEHSEIVDHNLIIKSVAHWVDSVVVDLNLCPFAKRELINNRVRFAVTDAESEEQLLVALQAELELLDIDASVETSLLIHPNLLEDFGDYNQFLNLIDGLLIEMQFDGVFQVASFHPKYQFAGTDPDDAENFTNRSPYPLVHILREDSLERAIAVHPDIDQVPVRNIELMNRLGTKKLESLLAHCFKVPTS